MNNSVYSVNGALELKSKKITKKESKLALLVPNMFNKVSSGYYKKNASIPAPVKAEVEPAIEVPSAPSIPSSPVVPVVNVTPAPAPVPATPVAPVEPAAPVANEKEEVKAGDKNYIEKVEGIDEIFLRNTKIHATEPAKKLLIATVFIEKLIAHREKAKKNVKPVIASQIGDAGISAKVSTDTTGTAIDNVNEAVGKYVELMNKRKEAIALKQQCEKEMTALVNKFNITLDMVNAELSRLGEQKVA